jgi:hypothetical protein
VGDFWRLPRLGPFRGISVHKNRALTRRDLGITSLSPLSARSIHLTCFAVGEPWPAAGQARSGPTRWICPIPGR